MPQIFTSPDANWQEMAVPAPPEYSTQHLANIEMPRFMALHFGLDPKTVTLGKDGVLRYVIVAQNPQSNTVNAMYEGIRCVTAEVRTYARASNRSPWVMQENSEWQPLGNVAYAYALARQGACQGRASPISAEEVVRALRRSRVGASTN